VTRIDFYVLPQIRPEARERFAVRLAARALREGRASLVLCEDDAVAQTLGAALWDEDGAFLPHARLGEAEAAQTPVVLATPEALAGDAPLPVHELLINLGTAVPERFASFDRVAEIVCQDDRVRAESRTRYRFYRERGYPLHHHDLGEGRGGDEGGTP
jgi:DNA polymerase-3 subunit chi